MITGVLQLMGVDLQKASVWKRFAAWLFDVILVSVLATGFGFLLSLLMGFDSNNAALETVYAKYETEYGVMFDITQEEYSAMTQEQQQNYDAAYDALIADPDTLYTYNLVINQILLIVTFSLLLSIFVMDFLIPLFLKNGQTVGKKIFGIGLMRTDGVRLTTLQLLVRSILGKYTVETMIPVYIVLMVLWGNMGFLGLVILAALLLTQVILLAVTRTNSLLHDIFACTVAVDFSSQKIFASSEELIAYTKRIHAEKAARQDY